MEPPSDGIVSWVVASGETGCYNVAMAKRKRPRSAESDAMPTPYTQTGTPAQNVRRAVTYVRKVGGAGAMLSNGGYRQVGQTVRYWVAKPQGVRGCGVPVPGRGDYLPVYKLKQEGSGGAWTIRGLRQCRNRWVCPYCSWFFRLAKADECSKVAKTMMDDGLHVGLMVLTFSHAQGEDLRVVVADAQAIWAQFRKDRLFKEVLDPCWFRALDLTVNGFNGDHPHLNVIGALRDVPAGVLGYVSPDGELVGYEQEPIILELNDRWRHVCRQVAGRGTSDHAFSWIGMNEENQTNLSKYAMKPQNIGFETMDNRYRRGSAKSCTLMELACAAFTGSDAAGEKLAVCASELHRVRTYSASRAWSNRIQEHLGVPEVSEEDDSEAVYVDDELQFFLNKYDYEMHRVEIEYALGDPANTTSTLLRQALEDVGVRTYDAGYQEAFADL